MTLSRAKRQFELHSNQAFPGTRLRLRLIEPPPSGALLFSARLSRPWMVGYFIRDRAASSMFSIIEDKRTCSPCSSLLCASRNRLIWTCCFLPGLTRRTATLHQSRACPCLFKRRIATMIPQQLSQKRPGGGHTIEHLSLGILPASLESSMYHRGPPMIHSHSCSTFIEHTSPPRPGALQG